VEVIIGAKCVGHDSSIFILREGEKPFGLDRERLTRHKHDVGFPFEPLEYASGILKDSKVFFSLSDNTYSFATYKFGSNRNIHSSDLLKNEGGTYRSGNPIIKKIRSLPVLRTLNKLAIEKILRDNLKAVGLDSEISIKMRDHHLCHAASAFYFSGLNKATVITIDGEGDGYSSKVYIGRKGELEYIDGTDLHNSIGHIYGSFTEAMGLVRDSDEGKVEALADFGDQDTELYHKLKRKVRVKGLKIEVDPSLDYKRQGMGVFRGLVRKYGDKDCAAAVQRVLNEVGVDLVTNAIDELGLKDFAFAGGCFANVKMNLRIFEETDLRSMYVFPAMGDSGLGAGAAIMTARELGWNTDQFRHHMPYFGPEYSREEAERAIKKYGEKVEYEYEEDWPERVAELVSEGEIVGIFQGEMEYGPRALGNRSVLADPRRPQVKDIINSTIKRRKPYQPFCPSVLESERKRLFENSYLNKHMTCAFRMKEEFKSELPSAIHVDGTARPQFVEERDNPSYYRLIKTFKELTGYGLVVNTSFNLHGRAMVMSPDQAMQDFMDCGLDYVVIEGWMVRRT